MLNMLRQFFLVALKNRHSIITVLLIIGVAFVSFERTVQLYTLYIIYEVYRQLKEEPEEGSIRDHNAKYFWKQYWTIGSNVKEKIKESSSFLGQIIVSGDVISSGSATLVLYRDKILLVTNAHVIYYMDPDESNTMIIQYRDEAMIISSEDFITDLYNDVSVSVVAFQIKEDCLPILELDPEVELRNGDEIAGYGYPGLLFGHVSGQITDVSDKEIKMLNTNVYKGFSGGPLVKGFKLAGIIKKTQEDGSGIVAIHPKIVARLADKLIK